MGRRASCPRCWTVSGPSTSDVPPHADATHRPAWGVVRSRTERTGATLHGLPEGETPAALEAVSRDASALLSPAARFTGVDPNIYECNRIKCGSIDLARAHLSRYRTHIQHTCAIQYSYLSAVVPAPSSAAALLSPALLRRGTTTSRSPFYWRLPHYL